MSKITFFYSQILSDIPKFILEWFRTFLYRKYKIFITRNRDCESCETGPYNTWHIFDESEVSEIDLLSEIQHRVEY